MLSTQLDHLVIAANSLEQGQSYLYDVYGLEPSPGGQHLAMGTHNSVLKLDNDSYLEIIALDPNGQKPTMPRWFNLDSEELQKQIKDKPKLITWVARTNNFSELKKQAISDIGTARAMRRGNLSWQFGFSDDGSLFAGGVLPYIIQWDSIQHVSRAMPEKNYSLSKLELLHPEANKIKNALKSLNFHSNLVEISKNDDISLIAHIETANGLVKIS